MAQRDEDTQWLDELLEETQLQRFAQAIHDELQVTRLDHFRFVETQDLEKIGMGRPAARRLLDKVNRQRKKSTNIIERVSTAIQHSMFFFPLSSIHNFLPVFLSVHFVSI